MWETVNAVGDIMAAVRARIWSKLHIVRAWPELLGTASRNTEHTGAGLAHPSLIRTLVCCPRNIEQSETALNCTTLLTTNYCYCTWHQSRLSVFQ